MITKDDDLLSTLIHDVARLLRLDIDQRVKKHNITRAKWLALDVIERRPLLTQAALAAELELGAAAIGKLVDRLEDRGLVVRKSDPDDRRSYRLKITPAAAKLLQVLRKTADSLRDDSLDGLSPKEIKALNAGLTKLKVNLQKSLGGAASVLIPIGLALHSAPLGAHFIQAILT